MTTSSTDLRAGPEPAATGDAVLVVANHRNEKKIERHHGPLADVAAETTMVCLNGHDPADPIRYREVPAPGHRLLGLPLLFFAACLEAASNDYDAVVAISLLPYGCFALVVGRLFGLPVHLGIIGADLDVHATAWYGAVPRALFRRFDSISVPGTTHVRQLTGMGVPSERVSVLHNAIDADRYTPPDSGAERDVDVLWVGRFSEEKGPVRFVEVLGELRERGVSFDAVMLGSGPLEPAVRDAVERHGLSGSVALPGWVKDPIPYYRRAKLFVVTSHREGLPFTLVESMATGVVPVVPPVGSAPDAVTDDRDGVVADRDPETMATALVRLLSDDSERMQLSENATGVVDQFSLDAAREDWRSILATLADRS